MSAQTIDRPTDNALWLAVEEALEEAECAACDQMATALLIIEPCGCSAEFCADCRRLITRTYRFRTRADIPQACQRCKTPAWDIRWAPLR